jgi:hypothetical protein
MEQFVVKAKETVFEVAMRHCEPSAFGQYPEWTSRCSGNNASVIMLTRNAWRIRNRHRGRQ